MEVDRTALWILMAACSVTGVACALRVQARDERRRQGRLARLGGYAEAVLAGVGFGLSAAFLVLVIAAAAYGLRTLAG